MSTVNDHQWWLSKQGTPDGPHSEGYILAGLQTGTISPQTFACPVGGQEWSRLGDLPTFASACPPPPPPSPPPAQPPTPSPSLPTIRPAWNPRTIAWLGLLFSPVWAGIMAAINARRLQMRYPIWQPIAVGIGVTIFDFAISAFVYDSVILDVILYLGAVGVIWFLYLDTQVRAYDHRRTECGRQAGWVLPALAGSPIAMLVIFGFLISPFLPLQPRQVCQKFLDASTPEQAKKYTTTKLWPVLEALEARKSGHDDKANEKDRLDLTDEAENPLGLGGYGVGCRMYCKEDGEGHVYESFFHLVDHGDGWKIEEWYLTSRDGEQAESPIAITAVYKDIFPASGATRNVPAATGKASPPTSATAKQDSKPSSNPFGESGGHPLWRMLRGVYSNSGWVGVVVILLILWGIGAACEAMRDANKKSPKPSTSPSPSYSSSTARCPHCHHAQAVHESNRGKTIRCLSCGREYEA